MNKKKIVLLSFISIFIPITIILTIAIVTYSTILYNEQKYYKKTNWNVSISEFNSDYYPTIKNYFDNHFDGLNIETNECIEKNTYILSYKNNSFQIKFIIEPFNDMCLFKCIAYFFYDTENYCYDDIKFFDDILSDFAKKSFYDYKITDGIISDIFESNTNSNSYDYYFDRGVGYLGCSWYFSEGRELSSDAPYALRIDVSSLLRDSDTYIDRIKI